MILHDQHIHSSYSEDSNEPLINYYKLAEELGCKYFVTTEHIDYMPSMDNHHWLCDFDKLQEELNSIYKANGPIPLLGIEMGYRIDYLNEINELLNKYEYDIINLSIHDSGKYEYYYISNFEELGIKQTIKMYYEQMLDAVKRINKFNVLSHIDYCYKTVLKIDSNYDFLSDYHLIKPILETLIKKEKALEINVKVQKALPERHLYTLLDLYKSLGGTRLTLSTDAHTVSRYKEDFDKYIKIIKDCGFNYLCYYIKQKEYHYDI